MKKRFFAAVVALVLVLTSLPVTALADDSNDHTPPHLIDVTFDKSEYNRGDTLIVTVKTDESESGFDFSNTAHRCVVTIATVDPNDSSMWLDYMYVSLTSANNGVLQGSFSLDSKLGGTYTLKEVLLCDAAGNSSFYTYRPDGDPSAIGPVPSRFFSLTSDYVKPPLNQGPPKPVLKSMTVNKKTFNVGDTITYTFKLTDPYNIGIHSVVLYVCMDGRDVVWYNVEDHCPLCSQVPGQPNTYTASISVTADMLQAHYLPFCILTTSNAGVATYLPIDNYNDNYRVQVINPARVVTADDIPTVTSFSVSTHDLVQGQGFSVSISLDKNPGITSLGLQMANADTCQYTSVKITLTPQSDGTFYGTAQFPVNLPEGHYVLSGTSAEIPNAIAGWVRNPPSLIRQINNPKNASPDSCHACLIGSDLFVHPEITVTGMDNETILINTPFDPLDGVTAQSFFNGDIMSKITVSGGSIDTSKEGVYLVKYVVPDKVTFSNGSIWTYTYTDYRWIGVSAVQPEAGLTGGAPLAVAESSMEIGAGSDATLKKDGKAISLVSEVTEPGTYTLSCGGTEATSVNNGAVTNISMATPKSTVTAVIDHSAPVAQAAWSKTAAGMTVALKGKDVSGVAEIRYMNTPGAYTVDDLKTKGLKYDGPFILPGLGKYTVYTRDNLGNEGVSMVDIKKPSTDSAYLSDIQLTGGTLSRDFSQKVFGYKVSLSEKTENLAITAVPEWAGSMVTIAGQAGAAATVPVGNGQTKAISIRVSYGGKTHVYTLTVKRAKSADNDLASLTATAGTFDKALSKDFKDYTLRLDENTNSVTIQAAVEDKTASPAFKSKTLTLNPGQTVIVKLKVRAQSGAVKAYTITVTRDKSTDAGLKSIITCPVGSLTPALGAALDGKYTVTLPAGKGTVTLCVAPSGYKASVTMDDVKKSSKKITLLSGQSITVHVVITAQAGNTQAYDVIVTRP